MSEKNLNDTLLTPIDFQKNDNSAVQQTVSELRGYGFELRE